MRDLDIEKADIAKPELQLALQLIEQISEDSYDPAEFEDEEKKRILAAIDDKIAGKQVVVTEGQEPAAGAQVIDLVAALKASLGPRRGAAKAPAAAPAAAEPEATAAEPAKERKGAKRATAAPAAEPPARVRARK